jgi:hypothetical protein
MAAGEPGPLVLAIGRHPFHDAIVLLEERRIPASCSSREGSTSRSTRMGLWRHWRQSGVSIERSSSRASRFQLHERLLTSAVSPSRRGGRTATFARLCGMASFP